MPASALSLNCIGRISEPLKDWNPPTYMARQGKRDKAWWSDDGEWLEPWAPRGLEVMDVERVPEWTGLYDADGNKLFRAPQPFGFRRKS